jgi:hypothetical protein
MAGSWTEILDSSKLGVAGGIAQLDSSGLLKTTQVPAIPSTKITGLISNSNIPNLDASKITSGAFSSSRIPTLEQSKINGLSTSLSKKVETSTTINGKALSANISINKADIGLSKVEDKTSAMIRAEITLDNITGTGLDTSNLIKEVTQLPASGSSGQMVKLGGAIYVWKES